MSQADFRKFEQQSSSDAWDQQLGAGSAKAVPKFDYIASTLSNKYSVKGLSYPTDLMDNEKYGFNKVIFYINASVDSKIIKDVPEVAVVGGVQRDMAGSLRGQRIDTASAVVASGGVAAAKGATVGSIVGSKGFSGALVGGALGLAGAGVVAYNSNNQEVPPGEEKEPTFTRPQKRLQAAIALYIPNQLSIRYSASWTDEDTVGFSAAAAGASEIARAVTGKGNLQRATSLGLELGTIAALKGQFGPEMGIATGMAANPKKEQSFKNVDFRTFSFEYNFAPRSEEEAQNVLNIIRAFKYHMHPEFKSENQFLYIYPSEFDVVYYKGNTENLNIHRHTSCVLTEANVNYTPNGVFSTFDNGMPTQIQLSLTFKELQLLTKETIERYT